MSHALENTDYLTTSGATGILQTLHGPLVKHNISFSLMGPHITHTPKIFGDDYQQGNEAFQKMRQALLPSGVRFSSSLTYALAVRWPAIGGIKSSGIELLVKNDEIHSLKRELLDMRPAWFVAKADAKGTRHYLYNWL